MGDGSFSWICSHCSEAAGYVPFNLQSTAANAASVREADRQLFGPALRDVLDGIGSIVNQHERQLTGSTIRVNRLPESNGMDAPRHRSAKVEVSTTT
jgi:hypothetical protein